jgi:hypothetical protein
LVISRRFCQMMGGDITVASEVGCGSTFTIRLPAEVLAAQPIPLVRSAPAAQAPAAASPLVLVIGAITLLLGHSDCGAQPHFSTGQRDQNCDDLP